MVKDQQVRMLMSRYQKETTTSRSPPPNRGWTLDIPAVDFCHLSGLLPGRANRVRSKGRGPRKKTPLASPTKREPRSRRGSRDVRCCHQRFVTQTKPAPPQAVQVSACGVSTAVSTAGTWPLPWQMGQRVSGVRWL